METSDRGRIALNLDDRTWQDLVDEARALIPAYAPQWTDHNPSDLGIALIELFAWLTEQLIFRLNQVPDKNYIALLNLLGITRAPAVCATTILTFTTGTGPVTVPAGTQAQTPGTETSPPVIFETDSDVTLAPTTLTTVLEVDTTAGSSTYTDVSSELATGATTGRSPAIAANQSVQMCLGFDRATTTAIPLRIQLLTNLGPGSDAKPRIQVDWVYSSGTRNPNTWTEIPGFPLTATNPLASVANLRGSGVVPISIPDAAQWVSQAPKDWKPAVSPAAGTPDSVAGTARYWIGLRITNVTAGNDAATITIGLSYLLTNAAPATSALTIGSDPPNQTRPSESLGTSDGTAFQVFALAHRPLYVRPDTETPYDHLHVAVNGTEWDQVTELPPGPGNVYRVDPVAGEISFGNFDPTATTGTDPSTTGNGTIPPTGAAIQALTYRYVADGQRSNAGPNVITALRTPIDGVTGVTNPVAASGGRDEEPIADTKRRASLQLTYPTRAVTTLDYETLARAATPSLATVRCLGPQVNPPTATSPGPWTYGNLDRSPGNVNVIIVPDQGPDIAPRPDPPEDMLRTVQAYLDRRRDLTARLLVTGPRYLPVIANIEIQVFPQAINQGLITKADDVYNYVSQQLQKYLHPVAGPDNPGWNVGDSVYLPDLFAYVMPPKAWGYISKLTLSADTPLYHNPPLGQGGAYNDNGTERPFTLDKNATLVQVADYELVCYSTNSTVGPKP